MSQIKPREGVTQRQQPFDDEPYRRYLHGQPCRRCASQAGCQAAHVGHSSTSMKASVDQCISLCPKCHQEFDTAGEGKEVWYMKQIAIPEAQRAYLKWKGDQT